MTSLTRTDLFPVFFTSKRVVFAFGAVAASVIVKPNPEHVGPRWRFSDVSFLSVCTGVPSSPRNVISIVNETSVILEWHSPRETGGRDDVVYNIVCKKCRADRRACSHCDDNVDFVPRQLGLTETRVFISNLLAHTLYSFEIQAVNGVSNKSPYPAQHVSIDITTNQAGKWLLWLVHLQPKTAKYLLT